MFSNPISKEIYNNSVWYLPEEQGNQNEQHKILKRYWSLQGMGEDAEMKLYKKNCLWSFEIDKKKGNIEFDGDYKSLESCVLVLKNEDDVWKMER